MSHGMSTGGYGQSRPYGQFSGKEMSIYSTGSAMQGHYQTIGGLEGLVGYSMSLSTDSPIYGIDPISMEKYVERYDGIDTQDNLSKIVASGYMTGMSQDASCVYDMHCGTIGYGLGADYGIVQMTPRPPPRPWRNDKGPVLVPIEKEKDDSSEDFSQEELDAHIRDIFQAVMDRDLPDDISISVLEKSRFHELTSHAFSASPGLQGFAKHKTDGLPMHTIVVKKSSLAEVLTVVGHEIGHVISEKKGNAHDEEAKAIAFEYAWVKTIKEFDLAGIGHIIRNVPLARNGLHDLAQMFVENRIKYGDDPLDIFDDIVADEISVAQMATHVLPQS